MLRLLLPILVSTALASEKPNIIVILADDHRYDFLSCHPEAPDFLETPNLDRMAKEGAHLKNAFVTTSLCSPSRASILTGQYMHHHRVVDNQRSVPEGTRFYPEYLQTSGYRTAMIGKWHMGHDNDDLAKDSTTGSLSKDKVPTLIKPLISTESVINKKATLLIASLIRRSRGSKATAVTKRRLL
jgi:arylsulfatase A-like enzyme